MTPRDAEDVVGRDLHERLEAIKRGDVTLIEGRNLRQLGYDVRALLARVEAAEAAHRALKLGLVEALGPSAEERPVLDAVRQIVAERKALEADKARLLGDFRKYGEHDEGCASYSHGMMRCDCGFTGTWFAHFPLDAARQEGA